MHAGAAARVGRDLRVESGCGGPGRLPVQVTGIQERGVGDVRVRARLVEETAREVGRGGERGCIDLRLQVASVDEPVADVDDHHAHEQHRDDHGRREDEDLASLVAQPQASWTVPRAWCNSDFRKSVDIGRVVLLEAERRLTAQRQVRQLEKRGRLERGRHRHRHGIPRRRQCWCRRRPGSRPSLTCDASFLRPPELRSLFAQARNPAAAGQSAGQPG